MFEEWIGEQNDLKRSLPGVLPAETGIGYLKSSCAISKIATGIASFGSEHRKRFFYTDFP